MLSLWRYHRPVNPSRYKVTEFLSITEKKNLEQEEGKFPGPDNVRNEFVKLLDEGKIWWITGIFNEICGSGVISKIWLNTLL